MRLARAVGMPRWISRGLTSLVILVAGCRRPADDTTFPETSLGQSTAAGPRDSSQPLAIAEDVPPPGPGLPISAPGPRASPPPPAPVPPPAAPPPAPDGGSGTAPSTSGPPGQ